MATRIALLLLLTAGCATTPPPAPAAEPAPPADPPPPADPGPPVEAPPRGKVVETRVERTTRTERFSVKLPDDLETDIPCSATGLDQFLGALFVRVRNRLELPPGFQAVMPGRPAVATVKVVIEVPPDGEPLSAKLGTSSGNEKLDQAVLNAVSRARCMPPPPPKLIDAKTRTFRVSQSYGFQGG